MFKLWGEDDDDDEHFEDAPEEDDDAFAGDKERTGKPEEDAETATEPEPQQSPRRPPTWIHRINVHRKGGGLSKSHSQVPGLFSLSCLSKNSALVLSPWFQTRPNTRTTTRCIATRSTVAPKSVACGS